ncbi:hypothetical protein GCM10010218_57790 [Streptomyces mashuensis]|uniref:Putative zinc-finger domain-containing protein n=1 Tax=Streptomyces mashuensis TaxID=33904 RepID=A0A919EF05_9ACTN|nr:hypothetical protein GCM10010218_57790 [Streptomyces mashuensis]
MTGSGGQSPAEHHLGDRLAALVDGELGHDSRERVLAHLATCWTCKAEADAQRRLKSVFAEAAVPPVSDALLARLHSLPAVVSADDDARGGPAAGGERGPGDARRGRGAGAAEFTMLPVFAAGFSADGGFPVHDVGRERGSSRGRRFAFAAAGAVSLAAFALVGGAQPAETPTVDVARRSGAPAATTASFTMSRGVSLLRPSTAPVLPPLVRTPGPSGATR